MLSVVGGSVEPMVKTAGARDADASRRLPARDPAGLVVVASLSPLSDMPRRSAQDRPEPDAESDGTGERAGTLPAVLGALLLMGWIVGRRRG